MKRLVLLILLFNTPVFATEKINYVDLGAQLLKDGYAQRAERVLEKVDVSEKEFDFPRYYTLKGILLHELSYPVLSNIFLREAIARGQKNPTVYLYMAKNNWTLQDYRGVIDSLNKAGDAAKQNEQMMVIKAEAYKQQSKYEEAWSVLDEGIERFPQSSKFYRQKFYYLLGLGFYKQANEYANKYLVASEYSAKDYLAVAYTLRENKQYESAAILLQKGIIRHPDDPKLVELLGQIYIDQDQYLAGAIAMDWSSIELPQFAEKAATLYLKAGQPVRSLQLNRRILDQKNKFRQRLSLDISLDDYDSMVSMVPALKRYGLLREDRIAYAVGYAYYQIGDYDNARKYLKEISDSNLFAKASKIYQQIEKCRDEPLACY